MDSTMGSEKRTSDADGIAANRRKDRRYKLHLDVKWKLIRRRRVLDTGTGHTVDISSGGTLFDAGRCLPEGLNVELSILWPVLLQNVAPLQLLASGRIVRSEGFQVAVQTVQHEFRTVAVHPEPRSHPEPRNNPSPASRTPTVYSSSDFALCK